MTRARRVRCVTGDPAVTGRVRASLAELPVEAVLDGEAADSAAAGSVDVAVVTNVGVEDPLDVIERLHSESPGLPIILAARDGTDTLVSDALVSGASSYVPLDDDTRLTDRLRRVLEPDGGPNRFFNHLVEHVGVGVGAYGRDGTISYANPAYASLLGLDDTAVGDQPIWSLNPDLDPERFECYFDSFDTGETRHADALHTRSDGTVVPVHTVTTQIEHDGAPLHVGTIMDVTQRVETQRKIEALHDVATALSERETIRGVHELVVDAAERILDLHACYFIEHRGDHFTVSTASDAADIGEQTVPEGEGVLWETYAGGEPVLVNDVSSHSTAQPSEKSIRAAVSVPVGKHGVFQAVSTTAGSFTEEDLELADLLATHAAAALDRVHFTAAIRGERDRLAALFENVPNPVIEYEISVTESDSVTAESTPEAEVSTIATDVNPAFESVFGYTADAFVGRNIDDVIVPTGDVDRARSYNRDLMEGRNVTAEVTRETADGPRDFLLDVVPLEIDAENAGGYAIYTDITEQKQRQRQLSRQNDRLEEFASVVSHDLRNPLNVATGRLELAATDATGGVAEHIEHARTALDRMDTLIADLLTLAREGRSLGETEPVDLAVVARDAWTSVETGAATLDLVDVPRVHADDDRVRQLFENLFRNSVEHGSTDSRDDPRPDDAVEHPWEAVTVTVAGTEHGFVVRDDGPGVPDDARDRVFTSGFTTSDEGTGFGLAIVDRIAGAHGWTVDVEESPDGGAAFVFTVPDLD